MKVLLLRGGAVGDCVITTPTIGMIRRRLPDAHITVVGDPYSLGVFDRKVADRFVPIGRWHARSTLQLLRDRFDLSIDLHDNGRSRVQSLLGRAERRIGFDKRALQRLSYTDPVPWPRGLHAVEREAALMRPLGIHPSAGDLRLHVPVGEADRWRAREILSAVGVERYAVFVATTGTTRPAWRHWPPERFAELATEVQRALSIPVVMTCRPNQVEFVQSIVSKAASSIVPLTEPMDLRTLTAMLAGAEFYFGYNTGPMHLAAAHDVPIAAFFDIPEDTVEWHPWTTAPYHMIQPNGSCSQPGCKGRPCLHTVDVDEAFAAIQSLSERGSSLRHRVSVQG